tara:strand:+ start:252 stop:608 length:357 start_codon:yes stop_codon:yes gene_type:complete
MFKYLCLLITTLLSIECSSQNSHNMQYGEPSENVQLRHDDRGSVVNYNSEQTKDDSNSTQVNNATSNEYRNIEKSKTEVRNIDSNTSNEVFTTTMIVIVYLFIIIWICNKVCKKTKNT